MEGGLAKTMHSWRDYRAVLCAVEAVAVVVGTDGDVDVEDGEVDCHFITTDIYNFLSYGSREENEVEV